jgi:hypothetical protein
MIKKPTVFYPTSTPSGGDIPATLARQFVVKKNLQGPVADFMRGGRKALNKYEGLQVHSAFEIAFNSINLAKTEAGGMVTAGPKMESIINQALEQGRSALKTKKAISQFDFVKDSVHDIAPDFLSNPNADMYVEQHFQKELGARGLVAQGGIMDLAIYDKATKKAKIYDWKSYGDLEYSTVESVQNSRQSKLYPYLAQEILGAESAEMSYYFNRNAYGQNSKFHGKQFHKVGIDATKLGRTSDMSNTLNVMYSEIEAYKQMTYSKYRSGGDEAVKRYIKEMADSGMCGRGTCNMCPIKYQCKFSNIISETIKDAEDPKNRGYGSYPSRKLEYENGEPMFDKEGFEEINRIREGNRTEAIQHAQDLSFGRNPGDIQAAGKEGRLAAKSFDAVHKELSQEFQDRVITGGEHVGGKLAFSILDNTMNAPFVTPRLRGTLKGIVQDRIQQFSEKLGSNVPVKMIQETIENNVFADEEFIDWFAKKIYYNASTTLSKNGSDSSRRKVLEASRNYANVVHKDMIVSMTEKIDDEVLRVITREDKNIIARNLPTGTPSDQILGNLAQKANLKSNPELYLKQVRDAGVRVGVSDMVSAGKSKLPVPAMFGAFVLSYIAGAIGVHKSLQNKMDKAAEWSNQDDSVNTGQHNSLSTMLRRMSNSDFGSPYIPFGNSTFLSNIITRVGKLPLLKNLLLKSEKGMHINLEPFGRNVKQAISDLTSRINPELFIPTAVGSAVLMTTLPNIRTGEEMGADIKDRQRRFKKLERTDFSTDSKMQTPESRLRMDYKLASPHGSAIVNSVVKELSTFKPFSRWGIKEVPQLLRTWKEGITDLMQSKIFNSLKPMEEDIGKAVFTDAERKATDVIRHGARAAESSIIRADVEASGIRKSFRSKFQAKSSMGIVSSGSDDINLRKMVNKKEVPTVTHSKDGPSKMPVMVARESKRTKYMTSISKQDRTFNDPGDMVYPNPRTAILEVNNYPKGTHLYPDIPRSTTTLSYPSVNYTKPELNVPSVTLAPKYLNKSPDVIPGVRKIKESFAFAQQLRNPSSQFRDINMLSMHYPNKTRYGRLPVNIEPAIPYSKVL